MQSEELVEKVAKALALEMYPDTRWPRDEADAYYGASDSEHRHPVSWHYAQTCRRQAKVAIAALSTDAEPVAWWFEAAYTAYIFYPHEKARGEYCARLRGVELKPLYAEPVKTAPAVAVKALEWREDWGGSADDIVEWVADTPWGRVFASVAGYRDAEGKHYERHADVPDDLRIQLQSDTEAHHKARILSALSAQVQDVAETELKSIDEMLMAGQGDDDGSQIMPDFEVGMSVAAKVEACLTLLEYRRDVIDGYAAVGDWRDDPAQDERWNAGLDFATLQLCKVLKVDPQSINWDCATETLEGDAQSQIHKVLAAAPAAKQGEAE